MTRTLSFGLIAILFAAIVFMVLPGLAPNGHVLQRHSEVIKYLNPETNFACKYRSPDTKRLLFLQYDPGSDRCPPQILGVVVDAGTLALVTSFVAAATFWWHKVTRGGYTQEG